jgi:hypothetical protein
MDLEIRPTSLAHQLLKTKVDYVFSLQSYKWKYKGGKQFLQIHFCPEVWENIR